MLREAHTCQMDPWGGAGAEGGGTGAERLDLRPLPRKREAPTAPPPFSSWSIKPAACPHTHPCLLRVQSQETGLWPHRQKVPEERPVNRAQLCPVQGAQGGWTGPAAQGPRAEAAI